MNLEDLLDENDLQQDEWSLTASTFGKDNQLTVVGWSGRDGGNKFYILKCSVCSEDSELFGGGYFRSKKSNFAYGTKVPCGCGKSPRWSKEQYTTICTRKAAESGYTFLGFLEDPVRNNTKLHLLCNKHGEWKSTTVAGFLKPDAGCPKCGDDRVSEKKTGVSSPLKVVTNTNDINQDEWSSTCPTFGENSQLRVIGWKGQFTSNQGLTKTYVLECDVCSNDLELFPDKYFTMKKGKLLQGQYPCGCSKQHKWTENQWKLRCNREALIRGYKFIGWAGEFKGSKTKLHMYCEKHGEWKSTVIFNFFSGNSCPDCGIDERAESKFLYTKEKATGYENSKLKVIEVIRTPRRTTLLWTCKSCGKNFKTSADRVFAGVGCSRCANQNQTQAYINLIKEGSNAVAIKFGIATDSSKRLSQQARKSVYSIEQFSIYQFPSVESCKQAERECKKELECEVVLKRDMKDGYTETTYVYNLDKIKQIYKKHGGVEV